MKCPKCNSQMTLFGSKIFEGAMICNECYEKLSSSQVEEPPEQRHSPPPPKYPPQSNQPKQQAPPAFPQRKTGGRVLGQIQKEKAPPQEIHAKQETPLGGGRAVRKSRKTEMLTPLTPTKLTGIVKAQQKREQVKPPEKERDFTPLSPNEFVGLFGGQKKEEFIEPQQQEEEFTPLTPDKYTGYQTEPEKQEVVESSLAETVGKFVKPKRIAPQETREDYGERLAPPRRKFPDLKLLSPKPLAPLKQKEQNQSAMSTEILEELSLGMDELSQKQEILGSYLVELYQRVDYQTKLLEEIYKALGGYLEESY